MVNTLTVTLQYMFLLVRNVMGRQKAVVLFPNGADKTNNPYYPHTFSWSLTGGDDGAFTPFQPGLHDITLCYKDAAGSILEIPSSTWPGPPEVNMDRLLRMSDVPKPHDDRSRVRKVILDPAASPADVGGRVWLPLGGAYSADLTVKGDAPEMWYLQYGSRTLYQNIVDQFQCEVAVPAGAVDCGFVDNGDVKTYQSAGNSPDVQLYFRNIDGPNAPKPIGVGILDDFIEMYRLTNMDGDIWPVPILDPNQPAPTNSPRTETRRQTAGAIRLTSSPDRPICGGGSGCDPDDPTCN